MIAWLKAHWLWLAGAGAALWYLSRPGMPLMGLLGGPTAKSPTRGTAPLADPKIRAVYDEATTNWPGGAGDPAKITLADQELYPGFYRTETGGYFNPDTGQSFSPGTSPPVYLSAYDRGERERVTIDASVGIDFSALGRPNEPAAETTAGGYDLVW